MTPTIKPCPFCGERPEMAKHFKEQMWRLAHRCPVVGLIMMDWTDDAARLMKRWNTRILEETTTP